MNSLSVTRRNNVAQSPSKTKTGFNKSIINLKTIGGAEGEGSLQNDQAGDSPPGKSNSPRKNDRKNQRGDLNQPFRRSIGRHYDETGSFGDVVNHYQGRQGENKHKSTYTSSPIGFSNISNLLKNKEQADKQDQKFDLLKNLTKTERIDSGSDYRTISSEIQAK